MTVNPKLSFFIVVALIFTASAAASERIDLAPGSVHEGNLETRNSSIRVADQSRVDGKIQSRNGSIRIGRNVFAGDIDTRNGSIQTGADGRFGRIETRNGSITVNADSIVSGPIHTWLFGTGIEGRARQHRG